MLSRFPSQRNRMLLGGIALLAVVLSVTFLALLLETGGSSEESEAVKTTVDSFFTAIERRDPVQLDSLLDASIQSSATRQEFIEAIVQKNTGTLLDFDLEISEIAAPVIEGDLARVQLELTFQNYSTTAELTLGRAGDNWTIIRLRPKLGLERPSFPDPSKLYADE